MSIKLEGPWPLPSVVTQLPNPQFSDVENHQASVNRQRSMNGTLYTYCKDEGNTLLTYTFTLTRMKSLELQAFVRAMFDTAIRLTDHKGHKWSVIFNNNPFETDQASRAVGPVGNREYDTVTLAFLGTLL
jgi:hypothetical protein